MAGMKTVELETLRKLMFLLDGWWNIFQSAVRPPAIVAMLEMDEPKKAIDFLRKTCNDYCDQLEKVLDGSLRPQDS